MNKRARLALILGGVAILMPQTVEAATSANRPAVDFHCTLSGNTKGAAGLSRSAVCARFVQAIQSTLKVRVVEVPAAPTANNGRWITVQVKLAAPAHAEAAFTSRLGRTVRKHPPIGIDVMDKSLNMREIDLLAQQVAEALRSAG